MEAAREKMTIKKKLIIVMHTLSVLIVYPVVFILGMVLILILSFASRPRRVINCIKWLDDKNMVLLTYYNHNNLDPIYMARGKKVKEAHVKETMDRAERVAKIREKDKQMGKKYMYSPARLAIIREMKNVRW